MAANKRKKRKGLLRLLHIPGPGIDFQGFRTGRSETETIATQTTLLLMHPEVRSSPDLLMRVPETAWRQTRRLRTHERIERELGIHEARTITP